MQPNICKFCEFLENPDRQQNWYDFAVVFQNQYFVAVPSIGCIVPGYLLVIPRRHVLSMAQINNIEMESLIRFTQEINIVLSEIWSTPIIFEHGACNENNEQEIYRNGSCIDHAHWHLVPGQYDFLSQLPSSINVKSIPSFEYFVTTDFKREKYLYYQDNAKNSYIIKNQDLVVGQFFRRILAKCANNETEWDYLTYPHLENIRETLDKIKNCNDLNKHEIATAT